MHTDKEDDDAGQIARLSKLCEQLRYEILQFF